MKFTIFILLLFISLFILTGCTYSLANDAAECPPCESLPADTLPSCPPCWKGLIPGLSTERDVLDFIDTNLNKDERSQALHSIQFSKNCHYISWKTSDGSVFDLQKRTRTIHVEHNVVSHIMVEMPLFGPTMQQVIELYGTPEYIYSVLAIGADGQHYFLDAHYPSRGLSFELMPSQTDIGSITPRTRVSKIKYYIPGDAKTFFITEASCFGSPEGTLKKVAELETSRLQPWRGFGQIDIIEIR